ncbi:MAG: protein tyrosine phosphatase [Spirochaetota bacterium]
MSDRTNVLFVCTANQQRSPTAEELYRDDPRFNVASAGTSRLANTPVTAELLDWADLVVVMEEDHRRAITTRFPEQATATRIVVLGIPDVYHSMDRTLQREIRERFEAEV